MQTADGTTVCSEMAHSWYVKLGNLAYYDTRGHAPQSGWGFVNQGPFVNALPSVY